MLVLFVTFKGSTIVPTGIGKAVQIGVISMALLEKRYTEQCTHLAASHLLILRFALFRNDHSNTTYSRCKAFLGGGPAVV